MPIDSENKYYDFEELNFEANCDIDNIINNFFSKYNEIKGDYEYITYKIKKIIEDDRRFLMSINGQGQDILNRIGKISFVKHYVIPEQNNGKEFYVYSIHSFIHVTPPVLSI
jgi:hypothetical protein